MSDIFGRRPLEFGGAFAADAASINFNTGNPAFASSVGLVTQNLQVSYQQPITRLYEVGTQLTYYVAGRPQGQINMARILGPGPVSTGFYHTFGNVCFANSNHLTFDVATGCNEIGGNKGAMFFLANNVLLQSLALSVAAQDMIINEQLSLFFTSLEAFDDLLDLEVACLEAFGTTCDGFDPFPPQP
jgi:hypothetical protein